MIATAVKAKKGSGFRRLAAYVRNPAKAELVRVTGCSVPEPALAIREIEATQQLNTRATASKTYHLVVSFQPGERPTPEQIRGIEDGLCAALGFEDHQRISAIHTDQAHLHLHVAINRIHPVTLYAIHPYRDHYRLQQAGAEMERRYGLGQTAHARDGVEAARLSQRRRRSEHAAPARPAEDLARERFRRDMGEARSGREKALKQLRIQQVEYREGLWRWHGERLRREAALDLHGHLRRDGFAHLAERRRQDREERLAREREERKRVIEAHPLPRWQDYVPGASPPRQERMALAAPTSGRARREGGLGRGDG